MSNWLVCGNFLETTGAKKISRIFNGLAKKSKLPPAELRQFKPSVEAWKKWQKGERTPSKRLVQQKGSEPYDRHIAEFIDSVLMEAGSPSFSWILAKEGEVNLSPVFAWNPNLSGLDRERTIQTAKAHAATYMNLFADFDIVRITAKICKWTESNMEKDVQNCEWPPIIMLPRGVGNALPCSKDIPLPWLTTGPPSDFKLNHNFYNAFCFSMSPLRATTFREWTMTIGHMSTGIVWLKWLKLLPGQSFFDDMVAIGESADAGPVSEIRELIYERAENAINS